MKNFLVVDGAINSTFDVFSVSNSMFALVFPNGSDVAFLDEVVRRVKARGLDQRKFFDRLYSQPVKKMAIQGLHGTLHSTGSYCDKRYFPSRKEDDVVQTLISGARSTGTSVNVKPRRKWAPCLHFSIS